MGLLRVFLNVSMSGGHDALSKLAKEHSIKTEKLELGEYILFVNSARDRVKLFASNNVIAYLRLPRNQKLNMNAIREIPHVFDGKKINYDDALKLAVDKQLINRNKEKAIRVI